MDDLQRRVGAQMNRQLARKWEADADELVKVEPTEQSRLEVRILLETAAQFDALADEWKK